MRVQKYSPELAHVGARTAGLELAVSALEDEPVGTRVAHVAHPVDKVRLGLDDFEGVDTARRGGHDGRVVMSENAWSGAGALAGGKRCVEIKGKVLFEYSWVNYVQVVKSSEIECL